MTMFFPRRQLLLLFACACIPVHSSSPTSGFPGSSKNPEGSLWNPKDSNTSQDDTAQEYLPPGDESSDQEESPNSTTGKTSQSLKTLEKLQQMLDDTDYRMSSQARTTHTPKRTKPSIITPTLHHPASLKTRQQSHIVETSPTTTSTTADALSPLETEKLWTSKDRSKYKKQQHKMRVEQQELEKQPKRSSPPINPDSDDEAGSESSEEDDDGLGYTLPNLPVYFSDTEGDSDVENYYVPPKASSAQQTPPQQQTPTLPQPNQGNAYYSPTQNQFYPPQQQQQPPYQQPPNLMDPNSMMFPTYPYTQQPPQQQQQQQGLHSGTQTATTFNAPPPVPYGAYLQQQLYTAAQQYAAWAAGLAPPPGYGQQQQSLPPPPPQYAYPQTYPPPQQPFPKPQTTVPKVPKHTSQRSTRQPPPVYPMIMPIPQDSTSIVDPSNENPQSLAEASSNLSFDSVQKLFLLLITAALLCYSAVSPRSLPLAEYNLGFYENIRIVSLSTIAPLLVFLAVFDARESDINHVVNALYTSFSVGYALCFIMELLVTTLVRLGVFLWWERDIFQLQVPVPILPWVLRETGYRPKRITLFAADFCASCVACPVIEEYFKYRVLQWSVKLPKNFYWIKKPGKARKKKTRKVAVRSAGKEVINANSYISSMLAVSIGLKLCDAGRRILMYTKSYHKNKSFYAICRGVFPIHELCGTMTALELAKRDILGVNRPLWQLLFPAVFIHGMANFRGMKPIFKWNSETPWSEMQLSPWHEADSSTFPQLLSKGFAKLMWLVILGRVLGYCIKNYYLINRQAVKRTTTYAGKHAAFSAELAAADWLKKTKEK